MRLLGPVRPGLLAWALALLGMAFALERPAPLLLNLGAGDEPFVRGFRGSWERDGLRQSGETMFRWTEDGARLAWPVAVRGRLTARMRVARFASTPAEITLLAGDRVVDRWTQGPLGWRVRSVELGDVDGPLALQFRSRSAAGDELGVALDWVEIAGAERLTPHPLVLLRLVALLVGVPLILALLLRDAGAAATTGGGIAAVGALAILLDRFGGLMALAGAGPPALVATAFLGLAFRGLARVWPESVARPALLASAGALALALVALSHPFYYYPDVDTHARYLAALRSDPYLAWDPTDYQTRTGAWTREIAGRRVAFPYSAAFHLAAWPLALLLGDVAALKALAALALGLTLLLVHALARGLGLGAGPALAAQALVGLLPVTSSRLVLALYPTLLGQSLDLLLLVHLVRRYPHLDGARDAGAACLVLVLAQAAYTGSLLNAPALVVIFVLWELVCGDRRRALRLLAAYGVAAALVVGLLYARFLPTLLRDVLPHARQAAPADGAATDAGPLARAGQRFALFYDVLYPLLLVPGLLALRAAPSHARRLLASALLAGGCLLVLRVLAPAVFRDAKEVELLAAPVAVGAAAGLAWLWKRGMPARAAGVAAGLYVVHWGALRAAQAYADRFLARGR